jgi:CrcB-like protein, Camphor Resistance (CrcB)
VHPGRGRFLDVGEGGQRSAAERGVVADALVLFRPIVVSARALSTASPRCRLSGQAFPEQRPGGHIGWVVAGSLATGLVNIAGSFILGLLIGGATVHAVPGGLIALFGTGLCGALTIYSTFGYETIRLLEEHSRP